MTEPWKDPVCGMTVEPDSPHHCEYRGIEYHFCSTKCRAKFQAAPADYAGASAALEAPAAQPGGIVYTCPMHPEIRQAAPGSCPKCGMALTPVTAPAKPEMARPLLFGLVGCILLLVIYFAVVGLISGMDFALDQFRTFWYFIVPLALGFGLQVGLYTHLRQLVARHGASGKVLAVSGTTSTAAMVSCCAHYLANIVPLLGVAGFLAVVAEYQVELFWVGLAFNVAGIAYITSKVIQTAKEHERC